MIKRIVTFDNVEDDNLIEANEFLSKLKIPPQLIEIQTVYDTNLRGVIYIIIYEDSQK